MRNVHTNYKLKTVQNMFFKEIKFPKNWSVLHGGHPVKCALLFTGFDQSSTKMKLL